MKQEFLQLVVTDIWDAQTDLGDERTSLQQLMRFDEKDLLSFRADLWKSAYPHVSESLEDRYASTCVLNFDYGGDY